MIKKMMKNVIFTKITLLLNYLHATNDAHERDKRNKAPLTLAMLRVKILICCFELFKKTTVIILIRKLFQGGENGWEDTIHFEWRSAGICREGHGQGQPET